MKSRISLFRLLLDICISFPRRVGVFLPFFFFRPLCLVQFSPPAIKVQSVAQFMSFEDKSAENFTFVLSSVIIFPVYSTGF